MTKKRKKYGKRKERAVTIPATGEVFLMPKSPTTGTYAGETVWYYAAPKSFAQTTMDYLKRWFR